MKEWGSITDFKSWKLSMDLILNGQNPAPLYPAANSIDYKK